MAVAIGSTKGAVAMRWRRLKERIEATLNSGSVGSAANTQATQDAGKPSKRSKKSSESRKRKAPADDNADAGDGDDAALPQVDGSIDEVPSSSHRQTRGKKLNYDISASFISDDDLSLISFETGDGGLHLPARTDQIRRLLGICC